MPSTYTLNNGIELIGTGEQSGTWGDTTNTNLGLLDAALDGQVTITLGAAGSSGSPNALPITDGTASNGRNRMVVFADGADLGATAYVQLTPNDAEKIIYIRNSLSGSRSVILFQGTYNASNDYEVPAGTTAVVYFDGAGAGAVAANVFNNAHFDAINVVGTVTATTVTATTVNATTVDAVTVEFDNLSGTGAVSVTNILDEDNMASDSATALATQQSIKAYVDAQVGTVDTLAEILAIGNTTGATDIAVDSAQKVQFRDAAIYINSSVDGQLDIVADTEIQIAATTVDLNGNLDVSGTLGVTGVLTATSLDISGDIDVDGTTNLDVVDIDGAVDMASTLLVTGVLTTTAATVSNGGGQFNGAINVGVDDTGYDVKFFGATTGKSLLWDESADSLTVAGNLSVDGGTIKLDGNYPVGTGNVALGDTAQNTTASYNTAVGYQAIYSNTTGNALAALGYQALFNNTGSNNSAVGYQALTSNTSGSTNTAVGDRALTSNTTADNNTAVGYQAGYENQTATNMTLMGYQAGYKSKLGVGPLTAFGYRAGFNTNQANGANEAFGANALYTNTSGYNNSAFGTGALQENTTGSFNVSVGLLALLNNTTASNNTAVGYLAGYLNTTGSLNVAVGSNALDANITGTANTAVGYNALSANTGDGATAVGKDALELNTTGANTAVGANALATVTSGTGNVGIGNDVLTVNTASNNTAVGYQAAYSNTTAGNNTAVGLSGWVYY
jgi:hypothetical protein